MVAACQMALRMLTVIHSVEKKASGMAHLQLIPYVNWLYVVVE